MDTNQDKIFVTSSKELNSEQISKLETKLSAKFGVNKFEYKVDKELIAGLVIQHSDSEYHFDLKNEVEFILNNL